MSGFAICALLAAAASQAPATQDASPGLAGHWLGRVELRDGSPGAAMPLLHVVVAGAGEPPAVTITYLPTGPVRASCYDVTAEAGSLQASFAERGQALRCTAALDAQGFLAGELRAGDRRIGTFALERTPDPETLENPQRFRGAVELPGGGSFQLAVLLAQDNERFHATVDLASQNAFGVPLVDVTAVPAGDATRIRASLVGHTATTLRFDLRTDSDVLPGSFHQGDVELPFELEPVDGAGQYRPQHPEPPYPYTTRDVVTEHPNGHILAGTLSIPDDAAFGAGPHPAAVLVTGSGPQDRDETIMGHKPFLVLADRLTREGIAVLRYDDRGVGASTGGASLPRATTRDFASDARAVIETLRRQPEIDADRIGVIGHSEGGVIAPMVAAADPRVAFVILIAGPCVPGYVVASRQLAMAAQDQGATTEACERVRTTMATALQLALAADSDPTRVDQAFAAAARARIAAMGVPTDDALVDKVKASLLGLTQRPWDRFFLHHDPEEDLERTLCPILAIHGAKDRAVWHQESLDALRRITGDREDVEIALLPGLNHLLQPCTTGRTDEYASISTTMDEQALQRIVDWTRRTTHRGR